MIRLREKYSREKKRRSVERANIPHPRNLYTKSEEKTQIRNKKKRLRLRDKKMIQRNLKIAKRNGIMMKMKKLTKREKKLIRISWTKRRQRENTAKNPGKMKKMITTSTRLIQATKMKKMMKRKIFKTKSYSYKWKKKDSILTLLESS